MRRQEYSKHVLKKEIKPPTSVATTCAEVNQSMEFHFLKLSCFEARAQRSGRHLRSQRSNGASSHCGLERPNKWPPLSDALYGFTAEATPTAALL
eukprot:3827818-Amphidinium_carterae.1